VEVIFLALFGKDIFVPEQATLPNQGQYNFTNQKKMGFLRLD
jgi:hypothetical protein